MALADPQSLTIDGDTISLPRVGFGDGSGRFFYEAAGISMKVSHSTGKRNRSVVRIDSTQTVDDPLLDTVNRPVSMSVQLVVDSPAFGFDAVARKEAVLALCGWLTASSNANTTKFIGGES